MLGRLAQDARDAEDGLELSPGPLLDRSDGFPQESPNGPQTIEARDRKRCQLKEFLLCPALVGPTSPIRRRRIPAAAGPVEPADPPRAAIEHQAERAQPRPLRAGADESLLGTMRKDVLDLLEKRGVVEHGLCGITTLPERAPPMDQLADLLRHIGQKELHEPRQVACRRANEEVQVIGAGVEAEELHCVESRGPRQYAFEDLPRLRRRTEKEPALKTADGHEIDECRVKHAKRSGHGNPP